MRCRAVPPPCHFSGGGCHGGGISVSVISAGLGGVGDLGRSRQVSAVAAVSVVSAGLCGLGGLEGLVGGVTIANFCSIFFREALEREARRSLVGGVTIANFRRRVRAGGHRTCHGKHRKNSRKGGQNLQNHPKRVPKPPQNHPRGDQGGLWGPSGPPV